jgi:hypothetical protein
MAEKEGKKWHDWLTAIGTVIALVLAGVTFHYQFLRKPRELTAVVSRLDWDPFDKRVTVRLVIWNDGSRDEVLEFAKIVKAYHGSGKTAKRGHLLGPEVIKPGEARAFIASQTLEEPDELRRFDSAVNRSLLKTREDQATARVKLILELSILDRDGDSIVSRAEMGELQVKGNKYVGGQSTHSQRLNMLVEETSVGVTYTAIVEMD